MAKVSRKDVAIHSDSLLKAERDIDSAQRILSVKKMNGLPCRGLPWYKNIGISGR